MRRLTVLALMLFSFSSQAAFACSFLPGYRVFSVSNTTLPETASTPVTPGMSVLELQRGTDDGNFGSCSDAGILTIAIHDVESAKGLGFIFELESGSFPDKVLPDTIISPIELANGAEGFSFVWLDLPQGKSTADPINVRISARAVSPMMIEGEKVFLDVRHP